MDLIGEDWKPFFRELEAQLQIRADDLSHYLAVSGNKTQSPEDTPAGRMIKKLKELEGILFQK